MQLVYEYSFSGNSRCPDVRQYRGGIKGRLKRCSDTMSEFLVYPMIAILALTAGFPSRFPLIITGSMLAVMLLFIKAAVQTHNLASLVILNLLAAISMPAVSAYTAVRRLQKYLRNVNLTKILRSIEISVEIRSKQYVFSAEKFAKHIKKRFQRIIYDSPDDYYSRLQIISV